MDVFGNNVVDSGISQNLIQNSVQPLSQASNETTVFERRQCWLCLALEEFSQRSSPEQWLKPCRCRGTAKWIHNECLQLWIDEKQELDSNVAVNCSQCRTQYLLVYPPNGKLVDLILWYEYLIDELSKFGISLCVIQALNWTALYYGAMTCAQIIGMEKTNKLLDNLSPTVELGLSSIPFILCAGKLIHWENFILSLWRRHYNKIPFVDFLTGRPTEVNVTETTEQLLFLEHAFQLQRNGLNIEINFSPKYTKICAAISGALLLPTFAEIFGKCLYGSIESDLYKTLLGGFTFIVIKGCFKIYVRIQQFIRQSKRKVLNSQQNSSQDSNEKTPVERRQCWLCLCEEELVQSNSNSSQQTVNNWLSPCLCRGTAKWVHNECLQQLIDEKQKLNPWVPVKCSQCRAKYLIVFPPKNKFVQLIVWFESFIDKNSPHIILCLANGALSLVAFCYGYTYCRQLIGAKKIDELLDSKLSFAVFSCLMSFPFILCAGRLINWENMILKFWRRHNHKIPFLSYLTGRHVKTTIRQKNMERYLSFFDIPVLMANDGNIYRNRTTVYRSISGALFLPLFAKYFGQCLYGSVESDLHKTLLGGLTFIAIKGSLKIYLRQQQFIRQTKRRILNYQEISGTDSLN